ncbi:hypothetical protein BH09ACT11_BH09ACT11_11140 [soil metagenome]
MGGAHSLSDPRPDSGQIAVLAAARRVLVLTWVGCGLAALVGMWH